MPGFRPPTARTREPINWRCGRLRPARAGQFVADIFDEGISGAKGRDRRPALDKLMLRATRREIDLVAAWSVDRLGRSLQELIGFLEELRVSGCDLYLHQQGLDTRTPSGRAMFGMLGVFAEFERAMIVDRVKAGMARAAAHGTRAASRLAGRGWWITSGAAIAACLAAGLGLRETARLHGVGTGVVVGVRDSGLSAAGGIISTMSGLVGILAGLGFQELGATLGDELLKFRVVDRSQPRIAGVDVEMIVGIAGSSKCCGGSVNPGTRCAASCPASSAPFSVQVC